jgi:F-type H+-transporting ATPase subunit gamma
MAGASMKDIKLRIKSVESTMQITKAMELVAYSKLRRAKERVEQSRPYFTILMDTLGDIARVNTDFSSPYTNRREVKRSCYIVIGGDRGLAGGYNSNIFKAVTEHIGDQAVDILPIGKKTVEFFERRGKNLLTRDYAIAADTSVSDCFAMANLLTQKYLLEEFDEVYVCYTVFVSMLTQTPQIHKILPLVHEEKEAGSTRAKELILYEPNAETVYNSIVPGYLAGVIYSAMCESVASEQGARRTAMDAASKNAAEMIDDLSLRYNRARQGAITQEITEIVAGAEH